MSLLLGACVCMGVSQDDWVPLRQMRLARTRIRATKGSWREV